MARGANSEQGSGKPLLYGPREARISPERVRAAQAALEELRGLRYELRKLDFMVERGESIRLAMRYAECFGSHSAALGRCEEADLLEGLREDLLLVAGHEDMLEANHVVDTVERALGELLPKLVELSGQQRFVRNPA